MVKLADMALHGIHHLALFTSDLDETVRFWTYVLKAPLVRAGKDADDPGLRQYYFQLGNTLVAFFEFPAQNREAIQFGWMHRVSLDVGAPGELDRWRQHIESCNVPVSE